jgi:hypothetical protein
VKNVRAGAPTTTCRGYPHSSRKRRKLPAVTAIDNPDGTHIAAVYEAFEEVFEKAEQAIYHITGATPDPEGELLLIETTDAATGNLVITWRPPFIPVGDEGGISYRN